MTVQRLAVLMACHNRREHTLACLSRLREQVLDSSRVQVSTFLVDDGSTDGTAQAVRDGFPEVTLLSGTGSLFWNGGMSLAFEAAAERGFDYYVLLNDDTFLTQTALQLLLDTHAEAAAERSASIVVGATMDLTTNRQSYGGWHRRCRWAPLHWRLVPIGTEPQRCDTMNGNCVLIPAQIVASIGKLDAAFAHAMGDLDYGLRAKEAGWPIVVAPGVVGTCTLNTGRGSWRDESLPVRERWRRMLGPKGLPPKEWLVFVRRHGGLLWPMYWANPYVRFWLRVAKRRVMSGSGLSPPGIG